MMTEVKAGTQVQVLLTPSRSGQLSLGVGAWVWGLVWRRVRVPVRGVAGDRIGTQVGDVLAEADVPLPGAGRQAKDLSNVLLDDAYPELSPYVAQDPGHEVKILITADVAGRLAPVYLPAHSQVWRGVGGGAR